MQRIETIELQGRGVFVVPDGVLYISGVASGAQGDSNGEPGEIATFKMSVEPGYQLEYVVGACGDGSLQGEDGKLLLNLYFD